MKNYIVPLIIFTRIFAAGGCAKPQSDGIANIDKRNYDDSEFFAALADGDAGRILPAAKALFKQGTSALDLRNVFWRADFMVTEGNTKDYWFWVKGIGPGGGEGKPWVTVVIDKESSKILSVDIQDLAR